MATNQTSSAATDIRDIKPPIEIPGGYAWLWQLLILLAVAVAAYLLWRWWKNRKVNVVLPPPVPAHVRAKLKLAEALALITQPKPFVIAVSDTARAYLEERFKFHAPERTTEEFLRELAGTKLLMPEQKESLGNFLASCDLVKFAKYEPGENELRELHSSAVRLVEETEPVMGQQPTEITPQASEKTIGKISEIQTRKVSKAKTFAIVGTFLQLAPIIWVVGYFVSVYRLLTLMTNAPANILSKGINAYLEIPAQEFAIMKDEFWLIIFGLVIGLVGLAFLLISLTSLRYRAEWFFWFLMIYGLILCGAFPFGTVLGIFFLVYCLTKRREFLNRT